MSAVPGSTTTLSYFKGLSLGDGWRDRVIRKYGQRPEIEFFSQEAEKGLKPFEEAFLSENLKGKARILDIGCGAGREAFPLAEKGHEIVGIDMTPRMIEIAREKSKKRGIGVDFQVGEAGRLAFPDDSFDSALMLAHLIQHIHGRKNRIKALNEVWRVLKPSGLLIMTIRNKIGVTWGLFVNFLYRRVKSIAPHNYQGNDAGSPYPVYSPNLWANGVHGLNVRVISLLVDAWRRGLKAVDEVMGRPYLGKEPGDYLQPNISPAKSSGLMPFHCYSLDELTNDLTETGFKVQKYRDTAELVAGRDFPEWIRKGGRHMIILCKKVHKV